jgi:hypothetical protein
LDFKEIAEDEQDIKDRVSANGCDAFLGFYSTVASSGLDQKLNTIGFDSHIFTPRKIERALLKSGSDWGRRHSLGKFGWADKIADVFMTAQSSGALGMAKHLVPDRGCIKRFSPIVGDRYKLDRRDDILSLKGLGTSEARKACPKSKVTFFQNSSLMILYRTIRPIQRNRPFTVRKPPLLQKRSRSSLPACLVLITSARSRVSSNRICPARHPTLPPSAKSCAATA